MSPLKKSPGEDGVRPPGPGRRDASDDVGVLYRADKGVVLDRPKGGRRAGLEYPPGVGDDGGGDEERGFRGDEERTPYADADSMVDGVRSGGRNQNHKQNMAPRNEPRAKSSFTGLIRECLMSLSSPRIFISGTKYSLHMTRRVLERVKSMSGGLRRS